jgi:replicative DNA helicase
MTEEQQERILAWLVQSPTRELLFPYLSDGFFESPRQKVVYSVLQRLWKKKQVVPTRREMRSIVSKLFAKENQLVRNDWVERVDGLYCLDVTGATMEELAERITRHEILKSASEAVSETDVMDVLSNARKRIDSLSNLLQSNKADDESQCMLSSAYLKSRAETMLQNPKPIIKLGFPAVDEASNGLFRGELAVVMAPVNTGKTMFLVNIAVNLLEQGHKVLFVNCDTVRDVVEQRLYACITGTSMNQEIDVDELHGKIEDWKASTKFEDGNFIYRQVVTHTATVSTLRGMVRQIDEKYGKRDVVILDYGDLFLPDNKTNEKRHQLNDTFEGLRGLAMSLDILVVTATQTNKSGLKTGRQDVITLDQIAEGFGKTHPMALCLTVNQTPAERACDPPICRINVAKTTHGKGKDTVIPFIIDYARAKIRQDLEGVVQKVHAQLDKEEVEEKKSKKSNEIHYGNDKYDPSKPKKKKPTTSSYQNKGMEYYYDLPPGGTE